MTEEVEQKTDYYVYAYLREDGTPYYVGKGRKYRAYSSQRSVQRPADKNNVVFIAEQMDEMTAFFMERFWIAVYGRKDNGTGILRNLTDGGEGTAGYKKAPIDNDTRQRMSDGQKGKVLSEETKRRISAAQKARWEHNDQLKKCYSEMASKRTHTDDAKRRIGEAASKRNKGRKYKMKVVGEPQPIIGE